VTIGLFGGSFNPPHVAHLAVAEACAEAAGLDAVWWMPTPAPPHKRADPALAAPEHRLAMVRLAAEGNDRFAVSDVEFRRPGPHYTVDTLRALREERPGDTFALVVGGDSLAAFATWREPEAILERTQLVVYRRPGSDLAGVPDFVRARATVVDGPGLELSGTELRARLAAGRSARYLVPDAVLAYIEAHGLYRPVSR
jgi:nicotinate-nucleotide adenylyltransferase